MEYSSSLKLNHIFRRLYSATGHGNSYLVLYARKNRTCTNRVGVTVSKKLGGAVVRNRVRRRLREVYRLHEQQFSPGWDIVVVARSRCIRADFGKLTHAYLSLAEKPGYCEKQYEKAPAVRHRLLQAPHFSLYTTPLSVSSHLLRLRLRGY